ncbi:MAG: chromosome partition protein [Actinomycetota bacterium]
MFLKSITLKGFKSFADSTTLVLEPGVTVVVGPNGSGKSNVVDAIAWVLGAQAPSSVRSQKMDDVIFAGTAKRPALGRAEVAMTIDNSAGLLPIDFSEVTVSRTLFRTGESEYAINGVSCRLLDVQELLSDAGVGRQQHVIVSQGQIDAVLNARPEDRRAIIEEASGVLKHRKRKEKAERRLESTEANLLRAQDLLREVRRQLKPLERQADAARRHGTLAAELRTLRLHVSGRDIAALQARTQALANDKARGDESENALRARLSALDAAVMSDEAQLTARGDSTINDELARVENLRGRARGLVQVVAERRRSVERERGQMMDSGVVAQLEGEAAEVRQQLEEVAQQLRDAGGMYVGGSAAEELAALQTATATAQARLDDAISAHAAASSSAAASAARVEAFQATIDAQALSAKTLSEAVGSVGTLLELVDIDDDWRVAVQAALGESLSAVVMSDVAGARAALASLRSTKSPGAVLALGAMSAAGVKVGELRAHVRAKSGMHEASVLLSRVTLASSFDAAVDAVLRDSAVIAVTRDGDRLSATALRVGLAQASTEALAGARQAAESAAARLVSAELALNDARTGLAAARGAEAQAATRAEEERGRAQEHEIEVAGLTQRETILRDRLRDIEGRLGGDSPERRDAASRSRRIEQQLVELSDAMKQVERIVNVLNGRQRDLHELRARQSAEMRDISRRLDEARKERSTNEKSLEERRELNRRIEVEQSEVRVRLEAAIDTLRRELEVEPQVAIDTPAPELPDGMTPVLKIRELERELRIMGPINPLALQEFEALQQRNSFLEEQLEDVKTSRRELVKVIKQVDLEIQQMFASAYADVRDNFAKLFASLFPGGNGRLVLTMPDDLLNTGIEVEAKPGGKNIKKLSLLSGGERALTALAFLFAVFRSRPSPFYVMDEVEAALDDVNLHRFLGLIAEFRQEAQLLIVSHQKRTMEAGDSLLGVTMQPGGSSRVVVERVAAQSA